ncbi:DUF4861 family protein [Undibacterium sp. TS12]|uniref:DUF4861 family protein n=1 Tax=Undibacterium sp. TS12 TaxID=2908202 RepID=UPI001F4CD50F|nr:DUF4861 family protein [Undibacterium sp. TS12]MCH8619769.1 DUF4861 domain-containing protein [Undibacterium sp. TS12]
MSYKLSSLMIAVMLVTPLAQADKLAVTASHELQQARPSETITLPWSEVNKALPGALIQRIAVKDKTGKVLPHQVTNVAPLSKDPTGAGIAYGELIFQYNFAEGEKTANFTVEKIDTLIPVFPQQAYARYVPERLDDFAWENDKIGHRTYGKALSAPAAPGSNKEVLRSSGLDIWFKRVSYPVVDRWYNKGHDHYHKDEGEGLDMYNVGRSRGAGGTGIWDGKTLHTSDNYASWKVIANGPIRAVFELTYDNWDAAGVKVAEVKRFTVDAGHYFDQIESTFNFSGPTELIAALGLNKTPTDKGQSPVIKLTQNLAEGSLQQWVEQASNGAIGIAIILPTAKAYAEDNLNQLVLTPVSSGKPLRYYAGAAWDRASPYNSQDSWKQAVAAEAARIRHPLSIKLSTTP